MGDKTKIEWAGSTWNPIRARNLKTGQVGWHCTHKSAGCINCYSESFNIRLGTRLPFKPGHERDIEIFLDQKMLMLPLRWKRPRKIFVCSMTDLFGDFVPAEMIATMVDVMRQASRHTFQVLTKRPDRMRAVLGAAPVLANVWLGFSAEDQETFYERAEQAESLAGAGWLTWCSLEPMIAPIHGGDAAQWLRWVVIGGESGRGARPFNWMWADDLVKEFGRAGVPCFVKQMGSNLVGGLGDHIPLRSSKGGDPSEWPAGLAVREFPQ